MLKYGMSALLAAGMVAALIAGGLWLGSPPRQRAPDSPQRRTVQRGNSRDYYPPIKIDLPSIENPVLHHAEEAAINDEAIVIGIVVEGEARAYLREAFGMAPDRHVVKDEIDSTPVAITHCDRIGCTRVLTNPHPDKPMNLRIGGWREDQTMGLIVNGQEFSQKSENLPLADVPFFELPWGVWRELFPDTLIYLGT